MRRFLRMMTVFCVFGLLTSCGDPEALTPGSDPGTTTNTNGEFTALKAGQLQTRNIDVPSGYTLVDMNGLGDQLYGSAWLPKKGPNRPATLPFTGSFINDKQQIFGPDLSYYQNGQVVPFGDPCTPIVSGEFVWDCSGVVSVVAQAQNGDAVVTFRQDATGTNFSPWRVLTVWRAATGQWQELEKRFGEGISFPDVAISNHGSVAWSIDNAPNPPRALVYLPSGGGFELSLTDACPAPYPNGFEAHPRSVNDIGEVLGTVVCQLSPTDFGAVSAQWSSTGNPVPLNDFATLFDGFGNKVGTRRSDGHTVIWLSGGGTIDLTAAAGGQTATAKKFMTKRGELFGFVGTQPVIWRFGF